MTQSASSNDVFIFSAVSGTSTQNFALRGGVYMIALAAVSWGTVTLNVLAADGATYVPFQTWSANAAATLTLVAGSYQLSYASLGVATLSLAQQPPSPDWRLESLTQPLPISSSGSVTTITTLPGTTELDLVGGTGTVIYTVNATGSTGGASLGSGDSVSGDTGGMFLYSGNTPGSGATGQIYISSGDTVGGTSGNVHITSGDGAAASGPIVLTTGAASGGTRGAITLDALHVIIANLPTSASGLTTGTLWNSSGVLHVA